MKTIEEDKLIALLENKFSLNEADAIFRVIFNKKYNKEDLDGLLKLIQSNNDNEINNYDILIDNY